MKKYLFIGVAIIIVCIVVLAVHKAKQSPKLTVYPSPSTAPTSTIAPSPTNTSKYSALVKSQIGEEFIHNCVNHYGSQSTSACICGADYLSAN